MIKIAGLSVKCTLLMLAVIFVSGCGYSMALSKGTKKLDLEKNSIAIASIKVANEYVPSYQPFVRAVIIGKQENPKDGTYFKVESVFVKEKDKYNEYLISVALPPGKYLIKDIQGESMKLLPPIDALSLMPVYLPFELQPNEIAYLGRIEGKIRQRQNDNELRAGSVYPLLDQKVAGYADGTYDIIITDNYDADMQHFTQEYPVLKNYTVSKSLLPPWKQPNKDEIGPGFLWGR